MSSPPYSISFCNGQLYHLLTLSILPHAVSRSIDIASPTKTNKQNKAW
ncbi:hypothetical protein DsansV1_C42g0238651 [Dioscorea sansibarensis]